MGTKRNKYRNHEDGTVELIILEKDLKTIKATVVFDIGDLETVQSKSWHLGGDGRVRTSKLVGLSTLLHRIIMDAPDDLTVDHIDGDPTNNRRSNLRLVTQGQNTQNRTIANPSKKSGLPLGVYHSQPAYRQPYFAQVMVFGEQHHKRFDTIEEASKWYWSVKQRILDEHKDGITLGASPTLVEVVGDDDL